MQFNNLRSKRTLIKVCVGAVLVTIAFYSLQPSQYDIEMRKAYEIKKSHPKLTDFDGFQEPPIPDSSENKKTLLGVDSNKNELRDDIEIWINRKYNSYNQRMAARQLALDMNYKLRAAIANEKEIISHSMSAEYTTMSCLRFIEGDKWQDMFDSLELFTFNTKERLKVMENINNFAFSYGKIGDFKIGET